MSAKCVRLGVVAAVAMLTAACLQKSTTHTAYLSPDGRVAWMAVENDVYSESTAEEQEYLAAAAGGRHQMALALEALSPAGSVRTRIVRDEAPFVVITDATFDSIQAVMQRLVDGIPGANSVSLITDGRRSTLTIDFDFAADVPATDGPIDTILADLEHLRIVMTEGRFVSAIGFDVSGPVATFSPQWMDEAEKTSDAGGTIRLALSWEAGPV
jgi:hypothetical protein